MLVRKIVNRLKYYQRSFLKKRTTRYFKREAGNAKFSIISNDCWGGEVYKLVERPFNTPFIGLMLMSPSYIKLLGNLEEYIQLPLNFKPVSRYPRVRELATAAAFPIAELGDTGIEIDFLHYKTEAEALEKWTKRVQRIDWNNLFIKYDCGKDYADTADIAAFNQLHFNNKLIIGKEGSAGEHVMVLDTYFEDAVKQFRNCFFYFDPIAWLARKSLKSVKERGAVYKKMIRYI